MCHIWQLAGLPPTPTPPFLLHFPFFLRCSFQEVWQEEKRTRQQSLLKALHTCFGRRFWWGGFCKVRVNRLHQCASVWSPWCGCRVMRSRGSSCATSFPDGHASNDNVLAPHVVSLCHFFPSDCVCVCVRACVRVRARVCAYVTVKRLLLLLLLFPTSPPPSSCLSDWQ